MPECVYGAEMATSRRPGRDAGPEQVRRRLGQPYRRPRWDRSVTGLQPLDSIAMAAPHPGELHTLYATAKPAPTAPVSNDQDMATLCAHGSYTSSGPGIHERSRGATRRSA